MSQPCLLSIWNVMAKWWCSRGDCSLYMLAMGLSVAICSAFGNKIRADPDAVDYFIFLSIEASSHTYSVCGPAQLYY